MEFRIKAVFFEFSPPAQLEAQLLKTWWLEALRVSFFYICGLLGLAANTSSRKHSPPNPPLPKPTLKASLIVSCLLRVFTACAVKSTGFTS